MMDDSCVLKIEKLENGYEVSIVDPATVKSNESGKGAYKDPWLDYAFKTAEEVKNFVGEHLDSLKPPPDAEKEYGDAFNKQTSTEND